MYGAFSTTLRRVGTLNAYLYPSPPSTSARPISGLCGSTSGTPMILKSRLAKVGGPWHSKQRVLPDLKILNPRRWAAVRASGSPAAYLSNGELFAVKVRSNAATALTAV